MTQQEPNFEEIFPLGARVRCESEMWECSPAEYGTVESHRSNAYGAAQWLSIRIDADEYGSQIVEYDYRYLDSDMRRSMVKLIK